MIPALSVIYLILDLLKIMNMIVVDMYFAHIIIVGRVLDMGISAAMWRVTNWIRRRINGKNDLRLRHGTQD